MRFDVAQDDGLSVVGWVTPDNPAAEPAIIVALDDGTRHRVPASVVWPDLRAHGLHATGLCGFVVDASACPGLAPWGGLAVYEDYTNTLIYRRPLETVAPIRLFHLETDAGPSFAHRVGPRFQLAYGSAEFIGEDTLAAILEIAFASSLLLSGALRYRRVETRLRKAGFRCSILLRDPVDALAARLTALQRHGEAFPHQTGWRRLGRSHLADHFAAIDLADPDAIARALERLDVEALRELADPVTRLLVTTDPQQVLADGDLGVALERLAGFDLIGFDDDLAGFEDALDGLLADGRRLATLRTRPERHDRVAAALAVCEPAGALVALDQALVATTREAFARAGR